MLVFPLVMSFVSWQANEYSALAYQATDMLVV